MNSKSEIKRAIIQNPERMVERMFQLTKALEFYADPWTWARVCADSRHMGAIGDFNFNSMYGKIAREALGIHD